MDNNNKNETITKEIIESLKEEFKNFKLDGTKKGLELILDKVITNYKNKNIDTKKLKEILTEKGADIIVKEILINNKDSNFLDYIKTITHALVLYKEKISNIVDVSQNDNVVSKKTENNNTESSNMNNDKEEKLTLSDFASKILMKSNYRDSLSDMGVIAFLTNKLNFNDKDYFAGKAEDWEKTIVHLRLLKNAGFKNEDIFKMNTVFVEKLFNNKELTKDYKNYYESVLGITSKVSSLNKDNIIKNREDSSIKNKSTIIKKG